MVDLNISLPDSFFQEEVRDGYLVSVEKKELWAVQLDLLNELDRVCRKYNLSYTIDFGTLLGAVRHKGFIPWDVDVDVSLLREDYDKLMEIGPNEFKEPYFLQNQDTDENYNVPIARLRRSDTTFLHRGFSLYKNKYNEGIFIDLYPLDNLPSNNPKEIEKVAKKCRILLHRAYKAASLPSKKMGYWYPIAQLRYAYFRCLYGNYKKAFKRLHDYSKSFNYSGYVNFMITGHTYCRPIKWYDKTIELPIEGFSFRASSAYDEILKSEYGNYMEPVVTEPPVSYYSARRSYKESLGDPALGEAPLMPTFESFVRYFLSCMKSLFHLR